MVFGFHFRFWSWILACISVSDFRSGLFLLWVSALSFLGQIFVLGGAFGFYSGFLLLSRVTRVLLLVLPVSARGPASVPAHGRCGVCGWISPSCRHRQYVFFYGWYEIPGTSASARSSALC